MKTLELNPKTRARIFEDKPVHPDWLYIFCEIGGDQAIGMSQDDAKKLANWILELDSSPGT